MSSLPAPSVTGSLLVTRSPSKIQLAFTVIYVVWGVTYAVNRIMALALPHLLAAGARFVLAGIFLAVIARWRVLRMPGYLRDWRFVAAAAILRIVLSNGLAIPPAGQLNGPEILLGLHLQADAGDTKWGQSHLKATDTVAVNVEPQAARHAPGGGVQSGNLPRV